MQARHDELLVVSIVLFLKR